MALSLFRDPDFMTKEFEVQGFYSLPDFVVLGRAYGVDESDVVKLLDEFRRKVSNVEEFVRGSFLSADAQTEYLRLFHDRLKMFRA